MVRASKPDAEAVGDQLASIAGKLGRQFPAVEQLLIDAVPEITAFCAFPPSHWRRIWDTNPLERVTGEIKRRTNVVGIFPNERSILRLVGAVLIECHDEWQIAERRYLSEGSMAAIGTAIEQPPIPSSTAALRACSRQEIIPAAR